MDGAVGKINVRREFSTAAKNATKKRHRRRLPPSFVSTPLTLSNLTHFFTPTEQDRRRAFVRLGFLWGGNQNIVQSQPSLQITPPRLTAEGFMLMAWRCVVERDQRARTLLNRARAPISATAAAGSGAQFVIPMTKTESVMPTPTNLKSSRVIFTASLVEAKAHSRN